MGLGTVSIPMSDVEFWNAVWSPSNIATVVHFVSTSFVSFTSLNSQSLLSSQPRIRGDSFEATSSTCKKESVGRHVSSESLEDFLALNSEWYLKDVVKR